MNSRRKAALIRRVQTTQTAMEHYSKCQELGEIGKDYHDIAFIYSLNVTEIIKIIKTRFDN